MNLGGGSHSVTLAEWRRLRRNDPQVFHKDGTQHPAYASEYCRKPGCYEGGSDGEAQS